MLGQEGSVGFPFVCALRCLLTKRFINQIKVAQSLTSSHRSALSRNWGCSPVQLCVRPPLRPSRSSFVFVCLVTRGNYNKSVSVRCQWGLEADGSCSSINIHFPSLSQAFVLLVGNKAAASEWTPLRTGYHVLFSKGALFPSWNWSRRFVQLLLACIATHLSFPLAADPHFQMLLPAVSH